MLVIRKRPGRYRWFESRVGRVVLFLGIVWSIEGAFLALQNGLKDLLDVIQVGVASSEIVGSPDANRHCKAPGEQVNAEAPVDRQLARLLAFRMGVDFGLAGAATFSMADQPEIITRLLQQVRDRAGALAVPAPELPVIRHMATAVSEFVADLDSDTHCTAAELTNRYTPGHGHLYKLGVVVGYAA